MSKIIHQYNPNPKYFFPKHQCFVSIQWNMLNLNLIYPLVHSCFKLLAFTTILNAHITLLPLLQNSGSSVPILIKQISSAWTMKQVPFAFHLHWLHTQIVPLLLIPSLYSYLHSPLDSFCILPTSVVWSLRFYSDSPHSTSLPFSSTPFWLFSLLYPCAQWKVKGV